MYWKSATRACTTHLNLKRGHASVNWNQHDEFFRFTRGRFVIREAERMAERHVKFDMNALCKIAGDAVGKQCIDVKKCADGQFNKAFLCTMDDNKQVVAKVPNPNAGRPHFTTASEVATMDFMRNVLATPAPRVLTWSSSSTNAVQSEYIIMEKANGIQLSEVWPTTNDKQKVKIMKAIAKCQKAWSNVKFNQIGSLYYTEDLQSSQGTQPLYVNESGQSVTNSRFAIGPIVDREWMDLGRADVECDRGPWTSAESYRRATIERDQQALQVLGLPPSPPLMLCGPSLYQPTTERKLAACEASLKVLADILPREQWATGFHMWHDDLHEENIFVDADDPTKINMIIDWQSTSVAPLFDHVMSPGYLRCDGPWLKGMEGPPPPNLSLDLSPEERAHAWKLYNQQLFATGNKHLLKGNVSIAFDALMYEESSTSDLLSLTRNVYERGEAWCLGAISILEDSPAKFSDEEKAEIEEAVIMTQASIAAMDAIKDELGDLFPEKGIVRHEEYDAAKAALRGVKADVLEEFAEIDEDRRVWEEVWPFDD